MKIDEINIEIPAERTGFFCLSSSVAMHRHQETGLGGGDLDRLEVCVRRAKQSADRRLDTLFINSNLVRSFWALTSCDLHNLILAHDTIIKTQSA